MPKPEQEAEGALRESDWALAGHGEQARNNQLCEQIMQMIMQVTDCSERTAQPAISEAWRGGIVQDHGQHRLPW